MSDAPEKIYAYAWTGQTNQGQWHTHEGYSAPEYIRADLVTQLRADLAAANERVEKADLTNGRFQRSLRETYEAMVAMRNSINEYIPMPSLESDLLQGPENSVFCATVAQAVVADAAALRAQNVGLREALANAAGALDGAGEELSEFANILSRDPWQANHAYESAVQARAALAP